MVRDLENTTLWKRLEAFHLFSQSEIMLRKDTVTFFKQAKRNCKEGRKLFFTAYVENAKELYKKRGALDI